MSDTSEMKWYTITVQSGQEDRIKNELEVLKKSSHILSTHLGRIVIVKEETIQEKIGKDGKKTLTKKVQNMYRGIMFVEMKLIPNDDDSSEAWYIVRNKINGVHGFVGSYGGNSQPNPLSKHEVEGILNLAGEVTKAHEVNFTIGDEVRIIMGPFANNEGIIEAMDDTKKIATVSIFILGRTTPAEVEYNNLQLID